MTKKTKLEAVPEAPAQEDIWITTAQAAEFVRGHIPPDADPDHDCETCRVLRALVEGFENAGRGDGQV